MTDDPIPRLRAALGEPPWDVVDDEISRLHQIIDRYRKATGGLDPALVAKYLNYLDRHYNDPNGPPTPLTLGDVEALRVATFEAPE